MSAPRPGGYCTECGHEVESFEGLNVCPACGTSGLPCAWTNEVDVTVNWHALRILVMWAEGWAREKETDQERMGMRKAVYAIARRLKAQHPDREPLTFAEEMGEVAAKYNVSVTDPKLRRDIAEQTGHEVNLFRPEEEKP